MLVSLSLCNKKEEKSHVPRRHTPSSLSDALGNDKLNILFKIPFTAIQVMDGEEKR